VVSFTESMVEQTALAWLESLGYTFLAGPEIAPGMLFANLIPGQLRVPDAELFLEERA
jgi:hypothetical protein